MTALGRRCLALHIVTTTLGDTPLDQDYTHEPLNYCSLSWRWLLKVVFVGIFAAGWVAFFVCHI